MVWSPGQQVLLLYLQDANLPGFLIIAVFAGLDLSLEVAESVSEKLFIQLVVVSLLTHDQQLLLLAGDLVRSANADRNVRFSWRKPSYPSSGQNVHSKNKHPLLPPVSSDSHDFGPAPSEHRCHGVGPPVFPCVPCLSAPPSEPGELAPPPSRTRTETRAESKEQEEQPSLTLHRLACWSFRSSEEQLLQTLSYLFVEFLQRPLLLPLGLLQPDEGLFERLLFSVGRFQAAVQLTDLLAQPGHVPLGLVQLSSEAPRLGMQGELRLRALGGFSLQLGLRRDTTISCVLNSLPSLLSPRPPPTGTVSL